MALATSGLQSELDRSLRVRDYDPDDDTFELVDVFTIMNKEQTQSSVLLLLTLASVEVHVFHSVCYHSLCLPDTYRQPSM